MTIIVGLTSTMKAAIGAMSEDDLAKPDRFEWTCGVPVLATLPINSYEHLDMHVPTIRAWLAANSR